MEKRIATFISGIFNPLVICTYFLVITLNLQFHFATAIPTSSKWMILGFIAITTFVIPGLLINISGIFLNKRMDMRGNERKYLPLAITSVFYLFTYYLINNLQISPIFSLFVLGMASLSMLSLLWMSFRNISLYMVATGALLGAFIGLHIILNINMIFFIALAVIIGGLTGFSRLSLEKHNPWEIYFGYALGALVMLAHYLYL